MMIEFVCQCCGTVVTEATPGAKVFGDIAVCPRCETKIDSPARIAKDREGRLPEDGTMTLLVTPERVVVQLIPRKRALKISIHLGLAIVMTAGIITTYLGQIDKVGVGATIWHTLVSLALFLGIIIGSAVYYLMSTHVTLTNTELAIRRSIWKWHWQSSTPVSRIIRVDVGIMRWGSREQGYMSSSDRRESTNAVNFELKDGSYHRYIASDRTSGEMHAIASAFDTYLKAHR
jgi:hypothetical protein